MKQLSIQSTKNLKCNCNVKGQICLKWVDDGKDTIPSYHSHWIRDIISWLALEKISHSIKKIVNKFYRVWGQFLSVFEKPDSIFLVIIASKNHSAALNNCNWLQIYLCLQMGSCLPCSWEDTIGTPPSRRIHNIISQMYQKAPTSWVVICLLTFSEMAELVLARTGLKLSVDKLLIVTFVNSSLVPPCGI